MARPTSPPPSSWQQQPARPSSPALLSSPRGRILSFFGSSSGASISRAKSPFKSSQNQQEPVSNDASPPVVSQLQLRPDPNASSEEKVQFPATEFDVNPRPAVSSRSRAGSSTPQYSTPSRPTSPFKLQRSLSRRNSKDSSISASGANASSSSSGGMFRRRPSISLSNGIGSADLPPPPNSDLTSPSTSLPLPMTSPPGSPSKRFQQRPFSKGISSPVLLSRPSSPTKEVLPSGAQSPRKRAIDKSMIGLPTNFKHTSSGSATASGGGSSSDVISLPGLSSPSSSGYEAREAGKRVSISSPISSPTRRNHSQSLSSSSADLDSSLAEINSALNNTSSSNRIQGSEDSYNRNDNRLDTVKEVPSGFIQRFEKAGQPLVSHNAMRADARWLFGDRTKEESSSEMERMASNGLPQGSSSGSGLPGDSHAQESSWSSLHNGPGSRRSASPVQQGSTSPTLQQRSISPSLQQRSTSPPLQQCSISPSLQQRPISPPSLQQRPISPSLPRSPPLHSPTRYPSSPPLSPSSPSNRMGKRKPVPKIIDDEPPTQSEPTPTGKPSTSTKTSTSASGTQWDNTLAEITSALKLDLIDNAKPNWGKEELNVHEKWQHR
ncbi:unnamed protein product [Sympodiomycopsis kandeliae]